MSEMLALERSLKARTREGELYERLPDDSVRCFACGHRCLIREGRPGVCKVRYNAGGALRVPWGYVAGLQLDPIEKKPFFHAHPGASALSFGMLGCDLHCAYCFTPETRVVTSRGVLPIAGLFEGSKHKEILPDGEVAYPSRLRAVTSSGRWRRIKKVFRHPYQGEVVRIEAPYLPPLRCTPDHGLYVSRDGNTPAPIPAGRLIPGDFLAIPKNYAFSTPQAVDVRKTLEPYATTYKTSLRIPDADIDTIVLLTDQGFTSRQIEACVEKTVSHIRHLRRKARLGLRRSSVERGVSLRNDRVRLYKEKGFGLQIGRAHV